MTNRSYRHWLETLSAVRKVNKDFKVVLRHDLDYGLKNAPMMYEIEREFGFRSVSYYDIHDPNYSLLDIAELCAKYEPMGFRFGLHINIAYDYDDPVKQLVKDINKIKRANLPLDSVVGHSYSAECAVGPPPCPSNLDLAAMAKRLVGVPDFVGKYFKGKPPSWHITDGGGVNFFQSPEHAKEVFSLEDEKTPGFFSSHPIHYRQKGKDLLFTKAMGQPRHPSGEVISFVQRTMAKELTPYLATDIIFNPHLNDLVVHLSEMFKTDYRRHYTVLDAGCGIGLVGAYIMRYNNCSYIGVDIEEKFIKQARDFLGKLGYYPELRVADVFSDELPHADVFIFTGAEDCPCDYGKLLTISERYEHVFLTIMAKEAWEAAKQRGKNYVYISEEDFERVFAKKFDIVLKSKANRVLYHLKRKKESKWRRS